MNFFCRVIELNHTNVFIEARWQAEVHDPVEARAQQQQMTYLVGGDAATLAKAQPIFETSAVKIIHAGPLGCGAKLKLCINLLTYIQWAAAYESYQLSKAVGLPDGIGGGGHAGRVVLSCECRLRETPFQRDRFSV